MILTVRHEKGFTLIELMATLAILALIVVIAVPAIGNIIVSADEKSEDVSIAMIENAGGIADVAGLAHDSDEQYLVSTLITEGYLDLDSDDALVINSSYVSRIGKGNTYVYNAEPEPTAVSMFTWSETSEGYTLTGFSDERADDLTIIVIPSMYNDKPVTMIGHSAFRNNNLTSVDIPNSVTTIGDLSFNNNSLSRSVNIPDSVTTIGDHAFANNHLTSVDIPNSVTSIGSGTYYKNHLSWVIIPNSVTTIGGSAFSNNNLTSVDIPNSVTSIGNYAFSHNNLTSVDIPNSVTSIGNSAFNENDLTSVDIPNSVTSIGYYAFRVNNLTTVTIPDTVTTIGVDAFSKNENLVIKGSAGLAASKYVLQDGQTFVETP